VIEHWQRLETGSSLLAILATLLVYRLCLYLFEKTNHHALLHPLLTGPAIIAAAIALSAIDFAAYQQWVAALFWMLGPATVALAIPLYNQAAHIARHVVVILITTLLGGGVAVAIALSAAQLLGADSAVLHSLASKSITTPIALSLSEVLGGIPQLAAGAVIITGVTGALLGPPMLRYAGITDNRVIGFTLGLTAHGIGTARAFDIDPEAGAYASLGMGLTGILTAFMLPLILV
jgi:putative effector of murein hydrolase